ncbi:MAG: winged helix-turn-helix domain-containing protein [Acidobacteriota bacterium]
MDQPQSSSPDMSASYAFGSFRLDADGSLFRGDALVHLPPRELAALRLLLAHAGQIVTPSQLKQALWGDVHVTADSLPKCLSSLRAHLQPEEFIQTVYKRGYRFTADVRSRGPAPAGTLPRLAIVPFAADHGVPEYLGASAAEETGIRLTRSRQPIVSVLARDSVFTLSRRGLTAQQIGETLRADLVLTGTLRMLPAHFRLRAEMIRVSDGAQIWVEDMLVERNRIAALEAELAIRLEFRLHQGGLSISAGAAEAEPENKPQHLEAFETFQRAHYEWQTLQRHRMQDGMQHLMRAIELDPALIPAHIDLANLCVTEALYGFMTPSAAADMVRRTAESIADLPVRAPAVLPALGWVCFHVDRDLPAALWAFAQSADLPHDAWTTRARAMFALSRHRFADAIALLRSAIRTDPFSPWLHARLAWALHLSGQASESVALIHEALALFPGHEGANLYGAMILSFQGEAEQGTKLAEELAEHFPYFDLATAVHAYALACAGQKDEARAILERLQWLSRERFVLKTFMPAAYVALEDFDSAISELQVSGESRCPWYFQMLADPRLKPLHGRREFREMLAVITRMEADGAASGKPDVLWTKK